jgi:alcohol dehydrogenase (cytochrome c)
VRRFSVVFFILVLGVGWLIFAQVAPTPTPMGFTSAQAEQGSAIYSESCVGCHGQNLEGSGGAPALSGATFLSQWRPKMVSELATEIHQTMPPTQPGSLDEASVTALTAFILQRNGAAASTHLLKGGDQAPIGAILSATPPAGQAPGGIDDRPHPTQTSRPRAPLSPYEKAQVAAMRAPLDRLTPVTGEMLRNPPPGDWLHWRRTYDGWAYSPLKQINRDTVKNLKVAWTWSMASPSDAVNEFTPLVHDGIMFLWNFGETVQALDAKTGTLLWQYVHPLPKDYPKLPGFYRTKRNLAIGGNKLIFPTVDMHIIALDTKTGKKLWEVVTDDYKSERTYNSGPLIVKDKVLVGAGNCSPGGANKDGGKTAGYFPPGGCFITRPRSRDREGTLAVQRGGTP